MANFHYKARGQRGDLIEGNLEAPSQDAAAIQLINTGLTPVQIVEKAFSDNVLESFKRRFFAHPPETGDLILYARQMHTMTRAGVPIIQAMNGIITGTHNLLLKEILISIRTDLESGLGLSISIGKHPETFPRLFIAMVRVGEDTGCLDQAFKKIADYLDLDKGTRLQIKKAIRYPIFVIVAVAIAIVNIFVIPVFAKIFASSNVELPWSTQLLISTSDFFVTYWGGILAALAVCIIGVRIYIKTEKGRYAWDKYKLKLPLSIILRATLGRFSRAIAISLKSGVPLIQSLTVIAGAVDNSFIGDRILSMRTGIERGESLTRSAATAAMFTPMVLQMLAVGEETGNIDDMMTEVADSYEREVAYDIDNLTATIEPLLTVVIGVMVLILGLGIYEPMWDLAKVASK